MMEVWGPILVAGPFVVALIVWRIDAYFPTVTIAFHVTRRGRRDHLLYCLAHGTYYGRALSESGVSLARMKAAFPLEGVFEFGHLCLSAMAVEQRDLPTARAIFAVAGKPEQMPDTTTADVFLAASVAFDALIEGKIDDAAARREKVSDRINGALADAAIHAARGETARARESLEKWRVLIRETDQPRYERMAREWIVRGIDSRTEGDHGLGG